jgi:hypothetical protein
MGEIVFIKGIIDAKQYIEILKSGHLKAIEKQEIDFRKCIFQRDNVHKHTAKITKE